MKKLFGMLIILFTLYLFIQIMFNLFSKGGNNTYTLTDENMEFTINEDSYFVGKQNNYYFNINVDNHSYKFQVNYNFNKANEVISKIKYFKEGNLECILPIFRGSRVLVDALCYENNIFKYHYSVNNENLNKFLSKIEIYDSSKFIDNTKSQVIDGLHVYKNNLLKNHYIVATNEKGIFDISADFNSVVYNLTPLRRKVENPQLYAFINEYYIIANYDTDKSFSRFELVNIMNLDLDTISSMKDISFNSYIQGIVDNKLYVYDIDNMTQYEINPDKETIIPYNGNSVKYYNNGTWTTISTAEANKVIKFKYEEIDYNNKLYERIDKVGNEVGYYYLYKKNGDNYDVYRMNIQDKEELMYLFSTKSIDNIIYVDDYVYFKNADTIQVFSDSFGIKNIIKLKENTNCNINVYAKH